GEIGKPLTLKVDGISAKAREKVLAAGGTVELIAAKASGETA
ncbi:MAG: uL15 family ribosomal protein, partial [Candidatus Binatia bacterium]